MDKEIKKTNPKSKLSFIILETHPKFLKNLYLFESLYGSHLFIHFQWRSHLQGLHLSRNRSNAIGHLAVGSRRCAVIKGFLWRTLRRFRLGRLVGNLFWKISGFLTQNSQRVGG